MQKFFADVEAVKGHLKKIKSACKEIQNINQQMLLATTSETEISQKLSPIIDKTNKIAQRCKTILNTMKEETDTLARENDKAKANEQRIRENLVNTLTRKFMEVVKEYQKRQQDYKDDVKKKVTRQVKIVKEDATPEEIDQVMKSAGGTGAMFKSAILKSANNEVVEAYSQAADQYQDVLRLEESMQELHQMFVDFALLTEQQGELLDQIEYQVHAASEYITDGNDDLEVAGDYQKSIRKKQCCVILIILVIAIAIMASVGAFG